MKAILIIDTPPNCLECQLNYGSECCMGNYEIKLKMENIEEIHRDCPLKSMPLRRMHEERIYAENIEYLRTNIFTEYDKCFNACIDEILGEE